MATASDTPFTLHRDPQGRLTLSRPGHDDVPDVRVRRAFPWSDASRFISIRNKDGKELLLIDDLDQLPEPTRATIQAWLASTSFIPKIARVEDIDNRYGYQQWRVQTDRGPIEFRVQEREDVRFMPDGRFSVKDADGNLYELGRLDELDAHSRRAVEVLL